MHTESVLTLLKTLQNQICAALEQEDGEAKFVHEAWTGKLGIGETRVLKKRRGIRAGGCEFFACKGKQNAGFCHGPSSGIGRRGV